MTTPTETPHKRKAVDETFLRLFGYEWGTTFDLNQEQALAYHPLIQIFGRTKTARIFGTVGKRRRVAVHDWNTAIENYRDIPLAQVAAPKDSETKIFAGQRITTAVKGAKAAPVSKTSSKGNSNLDKVLQQMAGPSKMSTVQKTSDDWESFKESDKQLQDELEKNAQGKDAFLVKRDFLSRVDQRKFELEREERDRERARRATGS